VSYEIVHEEGPYPSNNGPKWVIRIVVEPASMNDESLLALMRQAVWEIFEARQTGQQRPGALLVLAYYQGDDLSSTPTAATGVLAPFGDLSATEQHYPDSAFDVNIELMPAHLQPAIFPCRSGDVLPTGKEPAGLSESAESWRQVRHWLPPGCQVEVLEVKRFTNSGGQYFRARVRNGETMGWMHTEYLEVGKPFNL
jgi:hypothetical protein